MDGVTEAIQELPHDNHPAASTSHTVPPPVLFNAWKHHAGWVRGRIADAAAGGESELRSLADEVIVTGTKLMDFYTGTLTPWDVAERVLDQLRQAGRLDEPAFSRWVADAEGYRMIEMPDDGSRWVLRLGDGERYVHLHTARYSPHSLRVPGITLKTAIMANTVALTRGSSVADLETVNHVRREYLRLPPMAKLTDTGGLGDVVRLLAVGG